MRAFPDALAAQAPSLSPSFRRPVVRALFGTGLATVAQYWRLWAAGVAAAWFIWPRHDPLNLTHAHADLSSDEPRLAEGAATDGAAGHSHPFVLDDQHKHWPRRPRKSLTPDYRPVWLAAR